MHINPDYAVTVVNTETNGVVSFKISMLLQQIYGNQNTNEVTERESIPEFIANCRYIVTLPQDLETWN